MICLSASRLVARERSHQIDDRPPHARIADACKGLVELQSLAAAEEFCCVALCRTLAKTGSMSIARGQLFVEELHWHSQHLREIEQAARTDPVDPLLVLLDLLERDAQALPEFFLAHPNMLRRRRIRPPTWMSVGFGFFLLSLSTIFPSPILTGSLYSCPVFVSFLDLTSP